MKQYFKSFLALLFFVAVIAETHAQYGLTRAFSAKRKAYVDSLKKVDYPYWFPLLGQTAYSKGFDIPYPAGIMVNYFYAHQHIIIDNIKLGFEGPDRSIGPLDFSNVIKFGNNTSTIQNFNIRPDLWILPFINVYGLFAYTPSATTSVNLVEPLSFNSAPKQSGYTYGFGIMTAMNAGPLFISVDFNQTWTKVQLLEEPVSGNVIGLRMGHSFVFNNKPDRNLTFWVGAMRTKVKSDTRGKIKLGDALGNVTQEFVDEVESSDWYNDLGPARQEVIDNMLTNARDKIDNTYVTYSLDKRMKNAWSGCFGVQFQQNKRMVYRTEVNCIGDRFSLMLSANYRFMFLKRKNK